jgi:hypothetical protein
VTSCAQTSATIPVGLQAGQAQLADILQGLGHGLCWAVVCCEAAVHWGHSQRLCLPATRPVGAGQGHAACPVSELWWGAPATSSARPGPGWLSVRSASCVWHTATLGVLPVPWVWFWGRCWPGRCPCRWPHPGLSWSDPTVTVPPRETSGSSHPALRWNRPGTESSALVSEAVIRPRWDRQGSDLQQVASG